MSYKITLFLSPVVVNIFCQVLLAEKSLVIIPLIIAMKNNSNLNAQYSQFLILKRINCLLVETIKLKLYAMKNLRLILRKILSKSGGEVTYSPNSKQVLFLLFTVISFFHLMVMQSNRCVI